MIRVYIIVEGPTEEAFINDVLGPILNALDIYPAACLIGKPGHKGGNVKYSRVKRDVLLHLKQDKNAFCSTMLDLYKLGNDFPGSEVSPTLSHLAKIRRMEQAFKSDILASLDDNLRADIRFIPYLQLHEFEGLLFSDPTAFANGIYEPGLASHFQGIRNDFTTPEDINDGEDTAPSKRVLKLCPRYDKRLYGAIAAHAVGIQTIRQQCPHFNDWVTMLEGLVVSA